MRDVGFRNRKGFEVVIAFMVVRLRASQFKAVEFGVWGMLGIWGLA